MSNIRISVPRRLARLGIPVPPALATVFALDAALDEIRADQPVDALRSDLLAGKLDPTKLKAQITKTAQAMVAHERAATITQELDQPLEHLARIALRESADTIIEAMRPRFEQAVAAFMAALDALGPNPGPQIAEQSPLLARHYEAWRAAMDDCRAMRTVLLDIDAVPVFAWFTTEDTDAARQGYSDGEVFGLVKAGVACRLNTLAEAREVVEATQRAAQAQAEQDAAAKAKAREAAKTKLRAARGIPEVVTL